MSKAFSIVGVTEQDYLDWCKENKKPHYRTSTKAEFFKLIQEGKLVKDKSGQVVKGKSKIKRKK